MLGSPRSIAITDDSRVAYIAMWDKQAVAVFFIPQNKVLGYIPVGENPWDLIIDGTNLYVTNSNSNSISVIDMKAGK